MREMTRKFAKVRHILLFASIAAVYAVVQWAANFKDPDSFYHVKIAELMASGRFLSDFTWLPFTTLADAYADHHLLYHALLAPFVAVDPFVGAKVATVAFAVAAVAAVYVVLRKADIAHAWIYTLLLAFTSSFMFRINLTKASALALLLMVAAFGLSQFGARRRLLAVVGFLHVWTHGSWPALFAIVAACAVAKAVVHGGGIGAILRRLDMRPLFALFIGVVAGLVINPYFPQNLAFYGEQILQIAVIGHAAEIAVGAEWYPYPPHLLFVEASLVFLLFAAAVLVMGIGAMHAGVIREDEPIDARRAAFLAASFVLAVAFLLLSLRSRRHIEYFVPFAIMFDAALMDAVVRRLSVAKLVEAIALSFNNRVIARLLIPAAGVIAVALCVRGTVGVAAQYRNGIAWNEYRATSEWIAAHHPDGDVVMHGSWDSFPMLWYWDDTHRYVAGLDPTFLYRKDPDAYARWIAMTKGEASVAATMTRTFGAKLIVIEKRADNDPLRDAARRDPGLALVYEDDDAYVYAVL